MLDHDPVKKSQTYLESGNLEAHIIADMLRIESISSELRSFKEIVTDQLERLHDDSNKRLDKLENWIVAIVGISVSSLLSLLFLLVQFTIL